MAWGETSDFVLSTVLRTETGKKGKGMAGRGGKKGKRWRREDGNKGRGTAGKWENKRRGKGGNISELSLNLWGKSKIGRGDNQNRVLETDHESI